MTKGAGCAGQIHITRIGNFLKNLLIGKYRNVLHPLHPHKFDGGIAMNFYRWMMNKHLKTQAPVGDLARDMKGDKEFPHDGNLDEILEYLESKGACFGCMDACMEAWKQYERESHRAKTGSGS